MNLKICFATEVNYPNYVNRIKTSSLKDFIDKKLNEKNISYYISTNMPNNFGEYKNNESIKIFDINELRSDESKKYELLPENPTGLYPSKYPWNLRRTIIQKAAEDGFNYIIYIDADNVIGYNLNCEEIYNNIVHNYEPNTVQTNSSIFRYSNKKPDDVFQYHDNYIKHFGLTLQEEEYDTLDGPVQVFIGNTNDDIIRLTNLWEKFAIFGYKKDYGYGYDNNKHGNLSFVIPMSGFKLKWKNFPFYQNHKPEDRY